MFANLTPNQIRARGLAARLESALLASLSALPDSTAGLRNRIAAAARVRISVQTGSLTLESGWSHGPSSVAADSAAICRHTATELGRGFDALWATQEERGRELRAEAARLVVTGTLRRYFDLGKTRRATVAFFERALSGLEALPVRSADFDEVLALVAAASGFAIDANGYRLLDRSGRASSVVTTFAELGTGYSIADLRCCTAEAAEEFDDTAELIMALLSPAADGGVGDDVAAEAAAAGFDIADYSPTVDPALTGDEDLVQRYRRRVWLERKLAPVRAAAVRQESDQHLGAKAVEHAPLSAERASDALRTAVLQVSDDDWAEVWPELLALQTALAVDFIDRRVPRVYGRPRISFEDWARLRWARGDHLRDHLAESYLGTLKPKSGRSVVRDYESWARRQWIEAPEQRSISARAGAVDQDAWLARTIADRVAKRRSDARRHALELGLSSFTEERHPDAGLEPI